MASFKFQTIEKLLYLPWLIENFNFHSTLIFDSPASFESTVLQIIDWNNENDLQKV